MRHIACLIALGASSLVAHADTVSNFGFDTLPKHESVAPFSLTNNDLTATFTSDVAFYHDGAYLDDLDNDGTLKIAFSKTLSDLSFSTFTFSEAQTVNLETFLNGVLQSSQRVVVGDPSFSGPPPAADVDLTGTFDSVTVQSSDLFGITPLTATTASAATPEPSCFVLFGTGALGVVWMFYRRSRRPGSSAFLEPVV